jgi:hypothetical protein
LPTPTSPLLLQKAKGFNHTDVKVLAIAGEGQKVEYNR